MSLTNENPLLQHTKARGFLLSSASSLGRGCISDDKGFDKICPDDSAIIRTIFPHTPLGFAHWGFLRRADDAYTGNECKRKALIRGYSNQGCAHDCSARFALQGVRRSRPRWELALLDNSRTNRPFPPQVGEQKVIKLIVLRALNPLTKRTFT